MRWLAWLLTPLTLAAAIWAGNTLYRTLQDPLPAPRTAPLSTPDTGLALDLPQPQPPMRWPSLFGSYKPPEPQPPKPPAPPVVDEPQPPAPPIDSLGFALKGVVSNGDSSWAIVSHPTGERLMRVGDRLADGITVTAIEAGGVRLDNHGAPAFLSFTD
ncbi:type II secretion system protein N [Mameliella sp.]|uniref:type II secretion system protein N n=1 Tax=Mameliella sp. TaxID=1924940 RepID=UPI003BAB5033